MLEWLTLDGSGKGLANPPNHKGSADLSAVSDLL
jgi:hypothetical protein